MVDVTTRALMFESFFLCEKCPEMAKEDKDKLKEKWDNNTQKRSPDAPKQVHEGRHSS
jgi:hypothetical protein